MHGQMCFFTIHCLFGVYTLKNVINTVYFVTTVLFGLSPFKMWFTSGSEYHHCLKMSCGHRHPSVWPVIWPHMNTPWWVYKNGSLPFSFWLSCVFIQLLYDKTVSWLLSLVYQAHRTACCHSDSLRSSDNSNILMLILGT